MTELSFPTRFKARGPWLLDSVQLQRLEAAVDEFVQQEPTNFAALAGRPAVPVRSLTVLLSRGRELQVESFKHAFVHAGFQDEVPVGLVYRLKLGDTQAVVRISADADKERDRPASPLPGSLAVTQESKGEELEIEVLPRATRLSQELFGVLKRWAEDVEPPVLQRWLSKARPAARVILGVMLFLGLVSFFSPTTDYKQLYKEEAHKILKEGVNQSNQQRAIELLLALQTDYSPPVQEQRRFGAVSPRFVIIAVLSAIVAITPRICLGFWRGKRRLRLWRNWMNLFYVTILGLIVTGYLLPRLSNFVEKAFRH